MAFEITLPAAILPQESSVYVSGPVSEADVKLPVKESKKKPKKKESPRRAYSGSPAVVSNGRGPQTVKGFQLPYEEEFDMREYGVSNGTGKGYEGPFVEDEEVEEKVEDGARPDMSGVPGKTIKVEPGKDTWFSRMIRPDESELEAARNGLRWNWALEHRFMPPGSKWNETVWQGADRENRWLANMLKQRNGGLDVGIPTAATVRAREQSRRAIMDQYNRALAEYMKGHWDDPERAYDKFKNEVERLREQYRKAGEAYGAEFDPEDLRLPPPVSGSRSGFTTQSRPSKLREQYNYGKSVIDELSTWLQPDEKNPAIRKIDNPDFVKSKKAYLDSVYERILKHIKDSSNTMADQEKQRLQILVLPDNAYDEVVLAVKDYQDALAGIMSSASAKEWSENGKGKVNAIIEAANFDPSKSDKATLGEQLAALGGVTVSSLSKKDELPQDVASNLNAAKSQFDTYMKNMMLSASVAPHIVAQLSKILGDTIVKEYNDQAFVSGRSDADSLSNFEDISEQIPADAMPMSELIKRPKYIWSPRAKRPGDIPTTSNPASKGEQKPAGSTKNKITTRMRGI